MKSRLYENGKYDIGITPQGLNNTTITGKAFDMQNYRKAFCLLLVGNMAAGTTATLELLQAKNATGLGTKGFPEDATQEAKTTITANQKALKVLVTISGQSVGDTLIVNGITFTGAAVENITAREFKADGTPAEAAASLLNCINNPVYGVSGVKAENTSADLILQALEPGEKVIESITETGAFTTISTKEAVAFVELDVSSFDRRNDYTHLIPRVATTANTTIAVMVQRGDFRITPEQAVSACQVL